MNPFEVYCCYLALKNHFTKDSYDYFKYRGKVKTTIESFNKRKDKYFFEKTSRQKSPQEILEYFVSNFVQTDDPGRLWIGQIIQSGETNYSDWKKRTQSLTYTFKEDSDSLLSEYKLDDIFDCSKGHPPILKKFLSGKIIIETLVIYDKIFLFGKKFDNKLLDPVWETVSLKIKKYKPFLNIDVDSYKKVLREKVFENE
jgi:hypothetical protein